jgi:hypothetical protein
MAQSTHSRNVGAAVLVGFIIVTLGIVFYAFPPWEVATNNPEKAGHDSMAQLPIALWWLGSFLLATALIYGMLKNSYRTRAEKRHTDEATKHLYESEDRDAKREGLG